MSRQGGSGKIRIIGGDWRGRRLQVMEQQGLRPTPDRVRETLFNWLMPYVAGADCIDVCAGTGALAFECLSRGANSAVLLEKDKKTADKLQEMNAVLQADAQIHCANALSYLKQQPIKKFDIAFVDPPYDLQLHEKLFTALQEEKWLSEKALIYTEKNQKQHVAVPESWQLLKEGKAGQIEYFLYQSG